MEKQNQGLLKFIATITLTLLLFFLALFPSIPPRLSHGKDFINLVPPSQRLLNRKVKVMIVDTVIDKNHNLVKPFFSDLDQAKVKDSHGTFVSGIIAQRLNEVFGPSASDYVEFISCEGMAFQGLDNPLKTIRCFNEALEKNVDIVNYSGSGYSVYQEELDVLRKLSEKNVKVIVSAGNTGNDIITYPCSYGLPNIHCVGSLDQNGEVSRVSNFNPFVKEFAISEIHSSMMDNEIGYIPPCTSNAAPQMTALEVIKMITNNPMVINRVKDKIGYRPLLIKRHPATL